jgi:hypothetical protein
LADALVREVIAIAEPFLGRALQAGRLPAADDSLIHGINDAPDRSLIV